MGTVIITMLSASTLFIGYMVSRNFADIQRNASSVKYNEVYVTRVLKDIEDVKGDIHQIFSTLEQKDIKLISEISKKLNEVEQVIEAEKGKMAAMQGDLKESFEGVNGQLLQLQRRLLALTKSDDSLSRFT